MKAIKYILSCLIITLSTVFATTAAPANASSANNFYFSDAKFDYTLGKDSEQDKCNYVSVHGMEAAKSELHRLTSEAKSTISNYKGSEFFTELADQLEGRKS